MAEKNFAVPSKWTLVQIKAHWEEMKAEDVGTTNQEMEDRLKSLKRASQKKGDLTVFLTKEGIPHTNNMTVAQLFSKGERSIVEDYEPMGGEMMGFGQHGDQTLQMVLDKFPSYMTWVVTTAQESDTAHWRLKRVAGWVTRQRAQQALEQPHPMKSKGNNPYPKSKMPPPPSSISSGSFEKISGASEPSLNLATSTTKEEEEKLKAYLQWMRGQEETEKFSKAKIPESTDVLDENAQLKLRIMELEKEKNELSLQQARNKARKEM